MTTSRFPYEGRWVLVPELSLYDEGDPPRTGVYTIARDGLMVSFHLAWESAEGTSNEIRFAGLSDGTRKSIPQPPGAEVSYLHVDDATLDSTVFVGPVRMAYARRRIASDGRLLAVMQETRRKDGSTFRNFQVYRRSE